MERIFPPQEVILIDKESGSEQYGYLIGYRWSKGLLLDKTGRMVPAKEFRFMPAGGGNAFWTRSFPLEAKKTAFHSN